MKETTKIVFGQPKHIPSSLDGIEIDYPYQIITESNEKYKLSTQESSQKGIKATISGSLAITWGFQIWQPSENYRDLIKLLFMYVLEEVKTKYLEGTLNDFEEIVLLPSNHPQKKIYDINQIPEVNGYEEIINEEDELKPISEEIKENQLAGEIIQYRDLINALIYQKYSERLIELDQERNLLEFFKSAKSNEEFSHRIASLGWLVGLMNKKLLKKMSGNPDNNFGTIKLLEEYINLIGGDTEKTTKVLKQINRLRQGYPIHTDKANGVIEAHSFFNIDYPIKDFKSAWEKLLKSYLDVLREIFDTIKKEIMKKNAV